MAKLLVAANELGMMNGEYAFTTLDFNVVSNWQGETWAGGRTMAEFWALFDGIVNLSVKGPHGERFENYSRQLDEIVKANNVSQTPDVSIYLLPTFVTPESSRRLCSSVRRHNVRDRLGNLP